LGNLDEEEGEFTAGGKAEKGTKKAAKSSQKSCAKKQLKKLQKMQGRKSRPIFSGL
jgi:hypothetical protein